MTTTPRPPAAPPGLTVGGYALLTRIGEGGMGVVHLAQQPGGDRVALKVLRPHIVGDDEARARLAREVNSLRRIRSPRVAEIVDADPWGPVPFVATRYVPGLSLHDFVLEEGPISGRDLTWFAECLAEALLAVHSCGVLHRDVKPSNVLMEGRSPVLIDFGLARVADDPKLTHTGWLLGTPGYLAPEILYGEDATTASDVHSWAATVAYAGLARPPFGRGPSMAIMDRVRRGEHQLDGLPADIAAVVAAALDPTPSRRPGLEQILVRLRSGPAPRPSTPVQPPVDDPFTLPLAIASHLDAHQGTALVGPPPTRFETDYGPALAPAPPPPVPLPERLRRGSLVLALAAVATAAVAAYPSLAIGGLVLLVWVLRSGSLAATAAGARRQARGTRWYDGPQVLAAAPWHLVQSIPGTAMLVAWAGGLSLAGGLLGYAAWGTGQRSSVMGILGSAGVLLAFALWFGPGGSRVRGPVGRVVNPLGARPVAWLVAVLIVLATASGTAALAVQRGPDWAPFRAPLSGR